ncbi:hypothetical protein M3I53_34710 [Paraburkholderia sp. CNPSo 3272]|uniref:hypothetical protein n=1 Tax=Paraburkholderia sp. CNPSo 3272 TaxID=2940931 RepID=UPI0020B7A79F|nr:hypothetical protein [Paraburkholderia sp. CNPSo 3272]MCP3728201.1 hypothetical protein [Paraburkholderia sp. CNPSo 3272]
MNANSFLAMHGAQHLRRSAGAVLTWLLCALLAACGPGSNGGSSARAAAGAGGASAPVAIVAAPASGSYAALGVAASQPLLNTQLNCAP